MNSACGQPGLHHARPGPGRAGESPDGRVKLYQGQPLEAPFPWFGGKRKVSPVVWERFGDVPNYVEPFFGSGAILLGRPHPAGIETVNDKDGFVSNFWRAMIQDSEQVAFYADWPVNENDLHARHAWLTGQRASLTTLLEGDPTFCDAKVAGWWAWGLSCWIGSGFCSGKGPWHIEDGQLINRQLPHLTGERGVNRKRPSLRSAGGGRSVHRPTAELYEWFNALAERLRYVRVCSGDWTRILGPSPTTELGMTAVFLDPPYSEVERADVYSTDEERVARAVQEWAVANGDNPLLRIALCGYDGEHEMPPTWETYAWKAQGGYGGQGEGRGRENRRRERIWFSPACLKATQGKLL